MLIIFCCCSVTSDMLHVIFRSRLRQAALLQRFAAPKTLQEVLPHFSMFVNHAATTMWEGCPPPDGVIVPSLRAIGRGTV